MATICVLHCVYLKSPDEGDTIMKRALASLLALVLLATASGVALSDETQTLTADEIISKHLAAIGGKEALAKLRTRVAIGSVRKENEAEARMAIMSEAPNRVFAVYVFKNYDWQLSYDGKASVFRPAFIRSTSAIETRFREILASGFMFNTISLYSALTDTARGLEFQVKGIKKVRGKEAYVLGAKGGKDGVQLYFDTTTFMWVRTDYGSLTLGKDLGTFSNEFIKHADDQIKIDFYFETWDFREVDGVTLPFKFEQTATFPILRQTVTGSIKGTITEYRHNIDIDPKMFK